MYEQKCIQIGRALTQFRGLRPLLLFGVFDNLPIIARRPTTDAADDTDFIVSRLLLYRIGTCVCINNMYRKMYITAVYVYTNYTYADDRKRKIMIKQIASILQQVGISWYTGGGEL